MQKTPKEYKEWDKKEETEGFCCFKYNEEKGKIKR